VEGLQPLDRVKESLNLSVKNFQTNPLYWFGEIKDMKHKNKKPTQPAFLLLEFLVILILLDLIFTCPKTL